MDSTPTPPPAKLEYRFIPLCECEGKTIAGVGESWRNIVIRFGDGTYTVLSTSTRYDDAAEIDNEETDPFDVPTEAIEAGVLTHEDVKAHLAAEATLIAAKKDEQDRKELARLQAKFGGAS